MIGRLKATANRLGYHVISRRTADEILEGHPWLEEQLGGQSN